MIVKEVFAQSVKISEQYAFGGITSLGEGLSHLVQPGLEIAALAVFIYFLVGGVKFLLSGGDKNAVAAARDMIVHSIIGFVLLLVMFIILQFIPQFLGLDFNIIQ